MKMLGVCFVVALGMSGVLFAGSVENKDLTAQMAKIKAVGVQVADALKGIGAVNDQISQLGQRQKALQQQQNALAEQIKTVTSTNLPLVSQQVAQIQKATADAQAAAKQSLMTAQNSQSGSAELSQQNLLETQINSAIKDNQAKIQEIVSALKKAKTAAVNLQS